jgi:hypothetical protein
LDQALESEKHLSGFFWAEAERPHNPDDIFYQPERTKRPEAVAISASSEEEEEEDVMDKRSTRKRNNNQARNNR